MPIPPSESRRLLALIIISLIRKHLAELSLTLTRLRHFRSASILDRVDRCFHVCNPSMQYLRVFVPSIMEHRRACTEARRLASTLFFSQSEWGPTLDGVILENEPRKIPTFRYCRQLSAQGSVSHTTCLRLTSFSVFSVDTIQLALKTTSYEFSFLPSYTGSGHLTWRLCFSPYTHVPTLVMNLFSVPCAIANTRLANFLEQRCMVHYGKILVLTTRGAWVFRTIRTH